ncbi:uncharacterized protein L969DRAFT_92866 [Mixia osmundae IAM 14324]|uniref:Uncharacterized protein n=1 Tax=Mixia osmundae (strain CBS 9802 / IAM 14324 / JCM 22182 / KY 12970) TaxID=764103 RepID=G7DYT2_MIXOS|nr:uncharacterized protein L969DRAFT_92866 [Mixia osmundae IAM 14324]KEI41638.1 hypothetical protein L969DRAFT_92866 [Mixia osmundae IAM 14324]GAA95742.1 hypothetical protein E5Q_02399 [Mixia osmundae IAM 14324]
MADPATAIRSSRGGRKTVLVLGLPALAFAYYQFQKSQSQAMNKGNIGHPDTLRSGGGI